MERAAEPVFRPTGEGVEQACPVVGVQYPQDRGGVAGAGPSSVTALLIVAVRIDGGLFDQCIQFLLAQIRHDSCWLVTVVGAGKLS
jgi:hypothetical protein